MTAARRFISSPMKAILFAVLAGVCWGLGEVATKQVLSSGKVGTWSLLLVRVVGIVPIVLLAYWLAYSIFKSEPPVWWKAPAPVLNKLFFGSALLAGFGGVAFFYLGLAHGEISTVKPVAFALAPAIAAVFGALFLKEAMTVQKGVGIALMLVGLVLIARAPHGDAGHAPEAQLPANTPGTP